jgi:hypothetical protein
MVSRKSADLPLAVQLPAPDADRPSWVKVGVIAAVGFIIGVGWPRVMGVRLGPSAPVETSAAAPASAPRALDSASSGQPVVTPLQPVPTATAGSRPRPAEAVSDSPGGGSGPVVAAAPPIVTIGHGIVLTCRTEDGDTLKGGAACGALGGFDAVVRPRLGKLATCSAAGNATGKLSAVFSLDFKTNRVGVEVGKSSTVAGTDAFGACLRNSFQGVSLGPIQHDHVKYSMVYPVTFAASSSPETSTPPASPPARNLPDPQGGAGPAPPSRVPPPSAAASLAAPSDDGSAQVVWEVALVRDAPRTGQVVARLARGTKLRLGAGEDGWYKVQFGPSFGTEGYVYRGAIGK